MKRQMIILALLVCFCLITTVNATAKDFFFENETFSAGMSFVTAFEGHTFYIVASQPNTTISIDKDLDGGRDIITTLRNAGDVFSFTDDAGFGAYIHSNKPVQVMDFKRVIDMFGGWSAYAWLASYPAVTELGTEYGVPFSNRPVYIMPTQINTTIRLDTDGNRSTWEIVKRIGVDQALRYFNSTTLPAGTFVQADKPVLVVEHLHRGRYGVGDMDYACTCIYTPIGQDYVVPLKHRPVYIVATTNGTVVSIDTNFDGIVDRSVTLDFGKNAFYIDIPAGTRITANKPIVVVEYELREDAWGWWADMYQFMAPPRNLRPDYFLPFTNHPIYVAAVYPNTRVQMDTNRDGVFDIDVILDSPGVTYFNSSLPAGTHIHADKPIMVVDYQRAGFYGPPWHHSYSWATIYNPVPSISASKDTSPRIVGTGEKMEIKLIIFSSINSTATNFTINDSTGNFTPIGPIGHINLTITKYNKTDSVIASASRSVTTTLSGGVWNFSVSYIDAPILSSLSGDEYFVLKYEVIAPSSKGYYSIPHAVVRFTGETMIIGD